MGDSTQSLASLAQQHVRRICPAGDQAAAGRMIDRFVAEKGSELASDKEMAVGLQMFLWEYVLKRIDCGKAPSASPEEEPLAAQIQRLLEMLEAQEARERDRGLQQQHQQVTDDTLNAGGKKDPEVQGFLDDLLQKVAVPGSPQYKAVQELLADAGAGDPEVGLTDQDIGGLAAQYAALQSDLLDAASDMGIRIDVMHLPALRVGAPFTIKKQALTVLWAMQRLAQRLHDKREAGVRAAAAADMVQQDQQQQQQPPAQNAPPAVVYIDVEAPPQPLALEYRETPLAIEGAPTEKAAAIEGGAVNGATGEVKAEGSLQGNIGPVTPPPGS